MPDLVALEWEHNQIVGVLAAVTPGRVQLRQCFVIPQVDRSAAGAAPAEGWLKAALAQNRVIFSGEAQVVLPRDEAFVRRLELPDTPDEELASMVRFQMGAKSSVSIDEQYLDYLPLVKRTELPGREVIAVTVGRPVVDTIRQECTASGLNLTAVGLTAVAVAELVARAEANLPADRAGATLVVGRHGDRLEISVFRNSSLLFSHSARLNQDPEGTEPQSIVPEVSRALVALRGAISDVKIEQAWTLVGLQEHELLAAALQRRLSCDVQPLDPFNWVETESGGQWPAAGLRSAFAGPIGLLLARAEARAPGIDFLNPRKTVVKRDNRRQKLILAGAGAGALAAALIGMQVSRVNSLEGDIETLQYEDSQLATAIKGGQSAVNSLALVEKWQSDQVDWLSQLKDLTERMPPRDRIYLESLTLAVRSGNQPARIVANGFAREKKDGMELASALHSSDRYRVLPHVSTTSTADSYYPWRIEGQEIYLNDPKKTDKGSPRPASAARPGDKAAGPPGAPTRSATDPPVGDGAGSDATRGDSAGKKESQP